MFGPRANYDNINYDSSDMEADYSEIEDEERRTAKIARREDAEELRKTLEVEKKERMERRR